MAGAAARAGIPATLAAGDGVAGVRRDGGRLVFSGALLRPSCAGLWKQVQPLLDGIGEIDLEAVSAVDSAGLALLAEIASSGTGVRLVGSPTGLAELRAAYRLDDGLGYAR